MRVFIFMQNTGQILRSRKNGKSKYTAISNEILQSSTLTPQEKSILVHLLSLPEDWVVYKSIIYKDMNMGREQFNRHWKGLVEKGYIVSVRMIDNETNLANGWNHVVYEEPVLSENRTNQSSDLPNPGQSENPSVYKVINEQSNNQTKELNNKVISPTKGDEREGIFNEVWKAYATVSTRQPGSKKDAKNKFKRLTSDELEALRVHLPKYLKNHVAAAKTDYLPNFTTYLNQRRYEDEKMPYVDTQDEIDNWMR